jgi:hypothetical protein
VSRKSLSVVPWSYADIAMECDPHPFLVAKAAMPGDLVDIPV